FSNSIRAFVQFYCGERFYNFLFFSCICFVYFLKPFSSNWTQRASSINKRKSEH
ncbi:unnamed protein product, partial [Larinioides sclopetarius]